MAEKAKVVTLCGNPKLKDEIFRIANVLTLIGKLIINPYYTHDNYGSKEKENLADLQRQRIDMCDEVVVISLIDDVDEELDSQIQYAKNKGKVIIYYYVPPARVRHIKKKTIYYS
jgi:hypothetical protein